MNGSFFQLLTSKSMRPLQNLPARRHFQAESSHFTFKCNFFQYLFSLPQITHMVDVHETVASRESSFNHRVGLSVISFNIHVEIISNAW